MSRETNPAKAARLGQIVTGLKQAYPDAHCELNHSNPLDLLVATILSARCTDKQVNLVTAELFKKFTRAEDYARVPAQELASHIRRLGFFRNKARNIQGCCRALVEHHQGQVPRTMEALTQLDGVGRKTANVVLGNAFGLNEGVAVDTHVARLSDRLGLSHEKKPENIEHDLMKLVPQEQWTMLSHWLIWHGRRRCFARKPDCPHCEIRPLCPTGKAARK
jgi:endonuclease III